MKFKHDEKLEMKKVNILSIIAFLSGLSGSFFLYIMSTYLKDSYGNENIGIFYLISYAIVLFLMLNLHKIIKKIGKSDLLFLTLFLRVVAICVLVFVSPGAVGIAAVIAYIIFSNLQWLSLDMILESYSSDKMSGRIRGRFLTAMNIGVLLGPFLSTRVLENFNYYGIFLSLFVFNTLIFLVEILEMRNVNHHFKGRTEMRYLLKKILSRKNILRIFYIAFILDFFYALTIIYIPIYLVNIGVSWESIGIILTIMLLPFIFIQYPIGALADKKWGEKEMIIAAIFLMGVSTAAIFFINSGGILIWAAVLFLGRTGAAMIEILRDSYFYKRIDGHDVDLINIFRTSKPIAYIIGAAGAAALLFFLPTKAVFILVALVVLSALYPAIRLEDNL